MVTVRSSRHIWVGDTRSILGLPPKPVPRAPSPDLPTPPRDDLRELQMIYQMADTAMNPRQTVGTIIGRPPASIVAHHACFFDKSWGQPTCTHVLRTPAMVVNGLLTKLWRVRRASDSIGVRAGRRNIA
ncbi:hypothetical protein KDD17_02885 [Sulfitobacter albidus]|uniref:Uncharacterized protein n=1 Tax=Sulfitobacter albidus TaxID=2829501 RepID=A0A975JGH2_9RHOB|nr:hypothetical protein [Sulfitobacter albidus]QUJ78097.1 hypothetical protein KDD17_02885 [Sulfitobacter albidus]